MGRSLSSRLLHFAKMEILLRIIWQGLLLGLMVQPSEGEVLCAGTACYTLHFGRHSWMEAQEKCEDNGGNLMTLKSQGEAFLAWQLLDKMSKGTDGTDMKVRLWIGLHREKGICYQQHQPLKGFSWVKGGKETKYSNWEGEPRETCTARRCVTLQRTPSSIQELAWVDGPCSADGKSGYLCKFSFQGMCRPLVLAGPGFVRYTTPFGVTTVSLEAVPLGSTAEVACGPQGEEMSNDYFMCRPQLNSNASEWSSPGPFCASSTFGCSYSNGGCEHNCLDLGRGLFQCDCHTGYQLASDHLSCFPLDYCSSSPCQEQCMPRPGGFECLCSLGYMLADDGLLCVDVNECSASQSPCEQICVNTMGSFTCLCRRGYEPADPDSQACQDIDECARDTPCDQLCVNTHGSFLCSCQPGYQLEGINSSSCLDVDECLEDPCEHMCINHLGSYECSCRSGWTLAPNGISCLPDTTGRTSFLPTQGEGELGRAANIHLSSETPALLSHSSIQAEPERVFVSQDFTSQPSAFSSLLDAEDQAGDSSTNDDSGSSKQFLYYILGGVAVLLLLALALVLITCRKMKAKQAKKKSTSAADNYSWVPDQGETRA
ncbi:complement component C1q receptor [Rhineura floridana]|uniref:complement component C1q receptor n=1 Tax=Rhineura floridana TaxID=261503 RepID=UPI002AC893FA|nr:complement component C1q receptor [Rhineura floridana]